MKDTPNIPEPSRKNSADQVPSTGPGASDDTASTAPSVTLKEWEDNQPVYPLQRAPRSVVSHIFKDSMFGPRSWIIEPKRKGVRLDWVQIFQEAKAARDAAAEKADETEASS